MDRRLAKLSTIERVAEVVRYSILRTERWLSPRGHLREWLRINILAALVIGISALFVVPILTYLLGQFATWMAFLAEAARNFVVFISYMLVAAALITAAVIFVHSKRRH